MAHVVQKVKGVSIPIEIVGAIAERPDVHVGLLSVEKVPSRANRPDILKDSILREEYSPVGSYNQVVSSLIGEGYDIIHTHHNRSAVSVGLYCLGRDIIHFNTQHGHLHYTALQKVLNAATLLSTRYFSYNSAATKNSYNWIENALRSGGVHEVIHNGVDVDRLSRFRKQKYGTVRSIATAARLVPRKNLKTVVDALATVDDLELTIVGDGPSKEELQARAKQRGVTDRIRFAGYVTDREDVYRILSQADAFILPSLAEGFCVAVAEAMALGLPVVVSDIPVFHEVVGDQGLFTDPESPEMLGSILQHLIENPEEAKTRGIENRRRILRHFDLEDKAAEYVSAYRKVLRDAGA